MFSNWKVRKNWCTKIVLYRGRIWKNSTNSYEKFYNKNIYIKEDTCLTYLISNYQKKNTYYDHFTYNRYEIHI